MSDKDYFRPNFIVPYKPSLWLRFKLWLFGKPYVAVDLAREGETTVKWKVLNGKIYIQDITTTAEEEGAG